MYLSSLILGGFWGVVAGRSLFLFLDNNAHAGEGLFQALAVFRVRDGVDDGVVAAW